MIRARKTVDFYYPYKVLQDHNNFKQTEIAEALNISAMAVQSLMKGNPQLTSIEKLAKVVGAEPVEFFTPLSREDLIKRGVISE